MKSLDKIKRPAIYPTEIVWGKFRYVCYTNKMTVIEGYEEALNLYKDFIFKLPMYLCPNCIPKAGMICPDCYAKIVSLFLKNICKVKIGTKSLTIDSLVCKRAIKNFTIDSKIVEKGLITFSIDSEIRKKRSKTLTIVLLLLKKLRRIHNRY